ncbi:MAG: hypothetical protein OXL97_15380 [Chloroflexota bacterium]|nr:hypothetical protein [Chloroflexota bacterium]MDE2884185.1 hypothetical protein [Chloroflexota bacterium]
MPAAAPTLVPARDEPASAFVLDALLSVLGYRQDGTAEIELSVELRNDSDTPAQRSPIVTVECTLHSESLAGCGGPLEGLVLPDGVGREEAVTRLRTPMGTELRAVLEDGTASNAVVVPERILGVERHIWECFSDRPRREATYENDFLAGCGGWTSATVLKWDQEEPVRVWADPSGDARYVRVLEETLDGLGPLLGLDFEWVGTEAEATLQAYVGVPSTRAESLGLDAFCQDATGCAAPDAYDEGAIARASMSVWSAGPPGAPLTENEIAHVTLHEALHALAAMHHRPAAGSVMSVNAALRLPALSDSDEALLRLHAHPLVRPGMTMSQVRQLIVFADELLDPPADATSREAAMRIVERAYAALLQAGSARFDVRGSWPDRGCEQSFGGSYALGRFALGYPGVVRFDGDREVIVLVHSEAAGWTGWRQVAGGWKKSTLEQVYEATPWRLAFTDPVEMLLNVITHADPGSINVTQASEGTVALDATLRYVPPQAWARGVILRVDITLDSETHHISAYDMHWNFDARDSSACSRYNVAASNGEYSVEVPLPAAVSGDF